MLGALLLTLAMAAARPDAPANRSCASASSAQEDGRIIPASLLQAIALTESGRWTGSGQARLAWPWTVTAERKGRFFATRAAAIAHVRGLQARGVRNIDVGCMQVNLYYHPDAFGSLDEAFEPDRNAAYAARFLSRLKTETRSLARAVALYHSRDEDRGRGYWRKVLRAWNATRRANYEARRKAAIAETKARAARNAAGIATDRTAAMMRFNARPPAP